MMMTHPGREMTFLDRARDHRGGLIRFKREIWFSVGTRRRLDVGNRVFLLIDAIHPGDFTYPVPVSLQTAGTGYGEALLHVILDGKPTWIAAMGNSVELLADV